MVATECYNRRVMCVYYSRYCYAGEIVEMIFEVYSKSVVITLFDTIDITS